MRFKDRVAIVTGGTSGIGLAVARIFNREGAKVVLVGRDADRSKSVLGEFRPEEVIFVQGDVGNAKDCERCVGVTRERFGRIDILFNNAGSIYVNRTVADTTEEEWDETLNSNLKGAYLMSKFVIPHMAGGSIINNASIFGLVGGMGVAAYCAAKGGLINLTRAMALDHAAQNIRINCVCPGSVDTPLLEKEMEDLGGVEIQLPKFASRHPMNRVATPEEVANAVAFLASDEASFITGAALSVDGGRAAW